MDIEWAGGGDGSPETPSPARSSGRWLQIWGHRPVLLRVARHHSGCAEDGEDAVHEAMLRAAEHPEIGDERLRAWLISVTRRLCVDDHRRRVREARRWERMSSQAGVPDPEQRPEEEVCRRAEAAWVAARAAGLPRRQAQALTLTAAGCGVQQVATQLGVSYQTAESLLARARRTLRAGLTAAVAFLAWTGRVCGGPASSPVPAAVAFVAAATAVLAPVVLSPEVAPHTTPMPPPAVASTAVEAPVAEVPRTAASGPVRVPTTPSALSNAPPRPPAGSGSSSETARPAPPRSGGAAVAIPALQPPAAVSPPRAPTVPPLEEVEGATSTNVPVSDDVKPPRVGAPAPTPVSDPTGQIGQEPSAIPTG